MPTDRLTDKAIKAALKTAQPKARKLFDGQGLYLLIGAGTNTAGWRLKYRHEGREKLLSLGVYPAVSLAEARRRRENERKVLDSGTDPSAARRAEAQTRTAGGANSFETVARMWLDKRAPGWSADHAARTLRRMEVNVFPDIGAMDLDAITAPALLGVIRKIEARGAIETAHTVMQQCGQVFRFGIATGAGTRNPAPDIRGALQPVIVAHRAALTTPKEAGALMRAILDYEGHPVTRAALALSALVFQRPGNVRAAEWSEMDLDAAMWAVPSAKMKRSVQGKISGRPHLVPLSRQAVDVLRDLHRLTGRGRFVFPSLLTGERCMSENTVNMALRRLGYDKTQATAHGFRAMARTLLVETLDVSPDVIEAQLAHGKSGPLGAAYDRATFMAQRRGMMQRWADYLDTLAAPPVPKAKRVRALTPTS